MSLIKINPNNIKKVFILEDNEERIKFFQEILGDISYFITAKTEVAIKALKETEFDLLFLDHDLEEISIYDEASPEFCQEETGLRVANILRETINCETPCIIHSMNPTGASNMLKAHPFNTYAIPFHLLKECFIKVEK